jgi:hypothetical protein
LNNYIECECLVICRETKQVAKNEQMRGGRYGNEFGQSLYNAKEKGVEEGHGFLVKRF